MFRFLSRKSHSCFSFLKVEDVMKEGFFFQLTEKKSSFSNNKVQPMEYLGQKSYETSPYIVFICVHSGGARGTLAHLPDILNIEKMVSNVW